MSAELIYTAVVSPGRTHSSRMRSGGVARPALGVLPGARPDDLDALGRQVALQQDGERLFIFDEKSWTARAWCSFPAITSAFVKHRRTNCARDTAWIIRLRTEVIPNVVAGTG
jgi:hypothetical protein